MDRVEIAKARAIEKRRTKCLEKGKQFYNNRCRTHVYGTRKQVYLGEATRTKGGLTKSDLIEECRYINK